MSPVEPPVHLDITVHRSLHPADSERRLESSLERGVVPTRLLYESPRQVRMWQALATAYSPSADPNGAVDSYREIHRAAAELVSGRPIQLVGLACGDGRKERSLAALLAESSDQTVEFVPVEGSLPLIQLAASGVTGDGHADLDKAILTDLESVGQDLTQLIGRPNGATRVVTLYGVLPGMDPEVALSLAVTLLDQGDLLLVSSNSESEEPGGWSQVMAQYENDLTREWIGLMLEDLGLGSRADRIDFNLRPETSLSGMKTIEATIATPSHGQLTVFQSRRQTPDALRTLLEAKGLAIESLSVAPSGEEAIALARLPG